jgi:glycosyltransferase involved in cell wall biosynthesis
MSLVVRGHLDGYTGYGRVNCALALGLHDLGLDVLVKPLSVENRWGLAPQRLLQLMLAHSGQSAAGHPELLHAPPTYAAPDHPNRAWLVVWDANRLAADAVARLNRCRLVMTPSRWNRDVLLGSGVTAPVAVTPSFVPLVCQVPEREEHGRIVFGATANLGSQAERKNLPAAVRAFRAAFDGRDHVRLRIKLGQFDRYDPVDDPRVEIARGCWTDEEMCRWYGRIHVMVHPARNEAWGMQVLEAMASGCPVVAARHANLAEVLNDSCSLPVAFQVVPAAGIYAGHGGWAEPDEEDMARQLQRLADNPKLIRTLGMAAQEKARSYTVERFCRSVVQAMRDAGFH